MIFQNKKLRLAFSLLLSFVLVQTTTQKADFLEPTQRFNGAIVNNNLHNIQQSNQIPKYLPAQSQQPHTQINELQTVKIQTQPNNQSLSLIRQKLKQLQQRQKVWQHQKLQLLGNKKQLQAQLANLRQKQIQAKKQIQKSKIKFQKILLAISQRWKKYTELDQDKRTKILQQLQNMQDEFQQEKKNLQNKLRFEEHANKQLQNKTKQLSEQLQHQKMKFQGYYQISEAKLAKVQDQKNSLGAKIKTEILSQDSLRFKQFAQRQNLNKRILILQDKIVKDRERFLLLEKSKIQLEDCKKDILQQKPNAFVFFAGMMMTFLIWICAAQRKQSKMPTEIVIKRQNTMEQVNKLQQI